VQPEDLVEFGMIPSSSAACRCRAARPLDIEKLVSILTEPKKRDRPPVSASLQMDGKDISFHERCARQDRQACREARYGRPRPACGVRRNHDGHHVRLPDQPTGSKYVIDERLSMARKDLFAETKIGSERAPEFNRTGEK